jgi:hypothetical protein
MRIKLGDPVKRDVYNLAHHDVAGNVSKNVEYGAKEVTQREIMFTHMGIAGKTKEELNEFYFCSGRILND